MYHSSRLQAWKVQASTNPSRRLCREFSMW